MAHGRRVCNHTHIAGNSERLAKQPLKNHASIALKQLVLDEGDAVQDFELQQASNFASKRLNQDIVEVNAGHNALVVLTGSRLERALLGLKFTANARYRD